MSRTDFLSSYGGDLLVVNAARVSYDRWHDEMQRGDTSLIRRMASEWHDSPFYHPKATFRIVVPYYVSDQLKRHHVSYKRSEDEVGLGTFTLTDIEEEFDINQVSRRYTSENIVIEMPENLRYSTGHGQMSGGSMEGEALDEAEGIMADSARQALWDYNRLIEIGVAKEQARCILPVATITTWIWTGSLFGCARMCAARLRYDAQPETRAVAQVINDTLATEFPISWPVLIERNLKEFEITELMRERDNVAVQPTS